MSNRGIKRSDNSRVDNLSQKKYRSSNQDEKTREKAFLLMSTHSRRLVTPGTKLSHEYEEFVTKNTTASTKQRDHHQDSDSDNDDILSELSSPGNKKVPPFYPPSQEGVTIHQSLININQRQILWSYISIMGTISNIYHSSALVVK
jgi:hypothetical protein